MDATEKMKIKRFLQFLYLLSCLLVAMYAWSIYSEPPSVYDHERPIVIGMIFLFGLAFPSGFLYGIFFAAAMQVMPFLETIDFINTGSKYIDMLIEIWLPLTVIGYLQWFVALPWLWRKWKARGA